MHEIELSLANALHPRMPFERRATVGVCVTNKQAQGDGAGDGLSFDAADEQLLSALEREEQ